MKVAIITDTHFGARKSSKVFHDFFQKFYDDIFFPTLEERGIKTCIHMGDAFDNRKNIDFWSLLANTINAPDPLLYSHGIPWQIIVY